MLTNLSGKDNMQRQKSTSMHAAFYDAGLEDDLVNWVVAAIMNWTELTFTEKKQISKET